MLPRSALSWRLTVTMSPSQIAASIMESPETGNRQVSRILKVSHRELVATCTRSRAV
jgi:hypothetical protein